MTLIQLGPIDLARDFQVIDLRGSARSFRDIDRFLHRLDNAIAFAAHMGDVHSAAKRRFTRQRDQFRRFGIGVRVVNQRRGHAQRALLHRLADQSAHLRKLRRRRLHIIFAQHIDAHRARADERRDVGCNALALQLLEIFAERGPVDVVVKVALVALHVCFHGRRQRPHGILAHDLERHALRDVAERTLIHEQRFLRMCEHIDEPGRYRLAVRIDLRAARARRVRADIRDPILSIATSPMEGRLARTVIDQAIANDGIVLNLRRRRHARGSKTGERQGY